MSGGRQRVLALLLAAVPLAACGDGPSGPAVIPANLAGTWEANARCLTQGCGFTLSWVANPDSTVDLVRAFQAEIEVRLSSGGAFRLTFDLGPDTTVTGTARVSGSTLYLKDPAGVEDSVAFQVQGNRLELQFNQVFRVWDFDPSVPGFEPATARSVLIRR